MFTKNGNILKINGDWLKPSGSPVPPGPDPYNPLNLPDYTIRLLFKDNVIPTFSKGNGVQVSSSPNVWDLTYENNDWYELLNNQSNLLEVLGANTSNVTQMYSTFMFCSSLTSVSLFDTSNVTDMGYMFYYCTSLPNVPLFDTSNVTNLNSTFLLCNSLTYIPLFDTSKVITMGYTFNGCTNVNGGALALYQQVSTQTNPPTKHAETFKNCGTNTQTGQDELAQIPDDWK